MNTNPLSLVLMYHGVSCDSATVPPDREAGAELYDVFLENFKAQMKWLKDKGFNPVVLESSKTLNQAKPIIITFDDGEMNNFQLVLPVLKEFGWKAYFFVIVKKVGKNGYMGFKELKELLESGMVIGSHGLSHEILTNILDSQMEEELRASKKTLEINLGVAIDAVSIPRGFCNDKVIETAYRLGYKTVFISERPIRLKSKCLSRVTVKKHWSLERFDLALKGRTPLMDIFGDISKKILKTLLRESGYNWVRGMLLR